MPDRERSSLDGKKLVSIHFDVRRRCAPVFARTSMEYFVGDAVNRPGESVDPAVAR
jgi:hypothetical protein